VDSEVADFLVAGLVVVAVEVG